MDCFDYDKISPAVEYYEILQGFIERWEYETVDEDKIGKYFSAGRGFMEFYSKKNL